MEMLFMTGLLSTAGFFDVKERKIPNRLIVTGWVTAFVFQLIQNGLNGGLLSVLSVLITIAACFPLFRSHMIGAGDIKLLSVIGAMHGFELLWQVVLVWIILSALVSIVALFRRKLVRERFYHIRYYFAQGKNCGMPYYDEERDGRSCTIVLAPIMVLAYLLVQMGRWCGFC